MAILTRPDRLTTITTLPAGAGGLGADIRRIDLLQEQIAPATQNWVTPDDVLEVFTMSSLAGVSIQLIARVLLYDGTVTIYGGHFTSDASRVLIATFFPMHFGFMLGATAYVFGSTVPFRGQLLADLVLARSPNSAVQLHYGLGMDYLTRLNQINWPFSRVITGVEGPAALLSVLGTAPAAGAEFSQTVPTNARWLIRGVLVNLTTSGVAGNRLVSWTVDDGTNVVLASDFPVTVIAGSNVNIRFTPSYPSPGTFTAAPTVFLPGDLRMPAAWRFRSNTSGLLAGDQWGAPRFLIEESLEG